MKTFNDYGIKVKSGYGNVKTLCPNCSATRKNKTDKCLSVNLSDGVWHCHNCNWSGGLNSEKKLYKIPEYIPQKTAYPEKVLTWFKSRGISVHTLTKENVSTGLLGTETAIKFPYYKSGIVVNVKYRSGTKNFRQEKDAEKILYRFDEILKAEDEALIIVEGEMDALSLIEVGYKSVTSIPDGAPAEEAKNYSTKFNFLESAGEIFGKYNKIIIATDNDKPGQVAAKELSRRIGVEKCWRVEYPEGCKDINDVLVQHSDFMVMSVIDKAVPYPVDGILRPSDLKIEFMELYDNGAKRGVGTGWVMCDPCYTVKPGEMTIVTGIPGHGKSNWLDSLMLNISQQYKWSFGVFSAENWPVQRHLETLAEKLIRKPFAKDTRENNRMTKEEAEWCWQKLDQSFSFFVPKEDEEITVSNILKKAKVEILRRGVKGIVIDPWNELDHNFGEMSETQYISQQLTKVRRFAKNYDVHVWVVAHPRNLVKDKDTGSYLPPTMYEISGGANWRNKADNGLCVYRPNFKDDITELHIQKIRFKEVGRVGTVTFKYNKNFGEYAAIRYEF